MTPESEDDRLPDDADTYWVGTGTHQALADEVDDLFPSLYVPKANTPATNLWRLAVNCYFDLYETALTNYKPEFIEVFGFSGSEITRNGLHFSKRIEARMDEIIYAAALEQKIPSLMSKLESESLLQKAGTTNVPRSTAGL